MWCSFSCERDAVLVGTQRPRCQSNLQTRKPEWDAFFPVCKLLVPECHRLDAPQNGTVQCDPRDTNDPNALASKCSFQCNEGYKLYGDKDMKCIGNNKWVGNPPICGRTTCPALAPSEGRVDNCTGQDIGSTCTFKCTDDNKKIVGDVKIDCMEKKYMGARWSYWRSFGRYRPAVCSPIKCYGEPSTFDPFPGNITRITEPRMAITYTCEPGHYIEGSNSTSLNVTCDDDGYGSSEGTWSQYWAPRCSPISLPEEE